jgi:hypothetical protein
MKRLSGATAGLLILVGAVVSGGQSSAGSWDWPKAEVTASSWDWPKAEVTASSWDWPK